MKNKIKFILPVIIGIILILAVKNFVFKNEKSHVYSGVIEATTVNLSFRTSGLIEKIHVNEGERVKKGQLLASLDKTPYILQTNIAEADRNNAQAVLNELQNGFLPDEIKKAESLYLRVKTELENAQSNFERINKLYKSNAVSEREFENAQNQVKVLKHELENAQSSYNLIKSGIREEKIQQAKAILNKAQNNLQMQNLNLSYTDLYAPINGIISKSYREEFENIGAGLSIFSLINLSDIWVKLYIPESVIGKINYGQNVNIKTNSFPQKVFIGKVNYISSEAEFTPKSVHTPVERVKLVFRISVKIENNEELLKPGMYVDAVFE